MAAVANNVASCPSMDELVAAVKTKLKENRSALLDSVHPWTPWALVELLDIPDYESIPAELILYQALVKKGNRGIYISADETLEYEFKEVTKSGKIFFRKGEEYPTRCRRYVMEHKMSRGKVTAQQMWNFTANGIQPRHLGILANYLKTRNVSRRMKKMCREIRENHSYMLAEVPGL